MRDPQAFLCTDIDATPVEILGWFVHRWSVETTFQESRAHLGVETGRQWSDLAIARMTPALLGLFSLVTLWAADPTVLASLHPRSAAWYQKREPSFSDAIAAVRRLLWSPPTLSISRLDPEAPRCFEWAIGASRLSTGPYRNRSWRLPRGSPRIRFRWSKAGLADALPRAMRLKCKRNVPTAPEVRYLGDLAAQRALAAKGWAFGIASPNSDQRTHLRTQVPYPLGIARSHRFVVLWW